MTFLSKLGLILAKGLSILTGASPLISLVLGSAHPQAQAEVQTVSQDLTQIGQVVVTAESLLQGTGNGATKLAASTPLVASIVKTSEMVSGHQIANESLFMQGCTKITSGVADVLNSLSDKNLQSSGTPATVTIADVKAATSVAPPASPASPASEPEPAVTSADGSHLQPIPPVE